MALWSVLAPSLPDPLPDEAEQALDAFCSRYSVDSEHLGRVVRAARFVVRAAALRGLDERDLAADLAALTPDPDAVTTLVGGYPRARALLVRFQSDDPESLWGLACHGDGRFRARQPNR